MKLVPIFVIFSWTRIGRFWFSDREIGVSNREIFSLQNRGSCPNFAFAALRNVLFFFQLMVKGRQLHYTRMHCILYINLDDNINTVYLHATENFVDGFV